MNQQINLINHALIKQKQALTLNSMSAILGAMALVMIAYYAYTKNEVSAFITQRQQAADALIKTQNEIKVLASLHTPHAKDLSLEKKIEKLEREEKVQQQVLNILNKTNNTTENGYAALMRAFAKQNISGVWLTGFNVDSQLDTLNIKGRALQGDLVPQYINSLSNELALKGKSFSGLSINLPKLDASAQPPTNVDATTPTASQQNAEKLSTTTLGSVLPPSEPHYIEFSLESKHEDTSINASEKSAMSGGNS